MEALRDVDSSDKMVVVKFLPGDKVTVAGDIPAWVEIVQLTVGKARYNVFYWHDGKRVDCWVDEWELGAR